MQKKTPVEKALEEVEENVAFLEIGKIILNFLVVFLVLLLITNVFNISFYFALIISIIYLAYMVFLSFKFNRYAKVEKKIPELDEQLSTVADNVNKVNPIVDALKEDVVKNMNKIKAADLIDSKFVASRVLFIALISIAVIFVAYFSVNFDFDGFERNIGGFSIPGIRLSSQNISDINVSYIEGNLSSIFKKSSVAQLGTEELNLLINPLASDADVQNIRQVTNEEFTPPDFPKEIYTSYDVAYNEQIAKENQEVVKNYFEQITR